MNSAPQASDVSKHPTVFTVWILFWTSSSTELQAAFKMTSNCTTGTLSSQDAKDSNVVRRKKKSLAQRRCVCIPTPGPLVQLIYHLAAVATVRASNVVTVFPSPNDSNAGGLAMRPQAHRCCSFHYSVSQTVSQSVSQSDRQSVSQTDSQSVSQTVSQSHTHTHSMASNCSSYAVLLAQSQTPTTSALAAAGQSLLYTCRWAQWNGKIAAHTQNELSLTRHTALWRVASPFCSVRSLSSVGTNAFHTDRKYFCFPANV
jgi:hypothetical protein